MRCMLVVLLAAVLVAAGCSGDDDDAADDVPSTTAVTSSTTVAEDASTPTFTVGECPMPVADDLDVECGTVTVPENRDDPKGAMVELAVARVRSPSAQGSSSPVVRLSGGPGLSPLKVVKMTADEGGVGANPLLADHDLIYVDQRGTGFSAPSLECPEREEAVWETLSTYDSFEAESEVLLASLEDCRERLEADGVDLSAYDTVASASDLADVREAMGIDEWTLWGGSYGALLGQEIMRSHPEGIHAVVLDSLLAPDETGVDRRVRVTNRVLDVLFTGCEQSPECAAAYPNLRDRYAATLQAYNEDPFEATITDPDGNPRDVVLGGGEMQSGVFAIMYGTDQLAAVPGIIELMEQRSPAVQVGFEQGFLLLFDAAEAMATSVDCRDRLHHATSAEVNDLVAANPNFGFVYALHTTTACESWGAGASDASFNELVRSDIPTLVLAGSYDPITPPEDGRRVADQLDNATFVEFDGTGHGVFRSHACARQLVVDFVAEPDAPLDMTCVNDIGPPDFTDT